MLQQLLGLLFSCLTPERTKSKMRQAIVNED